MSSEKQPPREVDRAADPAYDATDLSEVAPGDAGARPQPPPVADAVAGRRLGDFEILREIGRGGMGIVYEARQLSLDRRVALKVLPPALGMGTHAAQRFEREARAAARLHHTNIVPVHAIGAQDGHLFYAMDLVEGDSLDRVLHDLAGRRPNPLIDASVARSGSGRPPQPAASEAATTSLSDASEGTRAWFAAVARMIAEVADALHYAHGRGVVHRDIKPANLMLSRDGRLAITDFGLARVAQEPSMTVSGSFMGTPAYMSPEQIASGRMELDHRTDVYSLGAVLYEMLTLARPFPGESREEVVTGILTRDPRPPRRFNSRVPVDLETICLKAMEKDPARRYATAAELADDLRRYLAGGLIAARRASLPRRVGKAILRRPVLTTVVAAALLLGAVGSVALLAVRDRRAESARRAVAEARHDLDRGEYRRAVEKADEALALVPLMPEARVLRAESLIQQWHFREAADEALAALERDPTDWQAHLVLARAASRGGIARVPVDEHLARAEQLAPATAEAFHVRALIADTAREALPLLDRALELDPGYAPALWERCRRRMHLKDWPGALADAERLVAVRPRWAGGHRMKGEVHRDRHQTTQALAAFDQAIALDAADPLNLESRGRLYEANGDVDAAVADFTRAIELDPRHGRLLVRRAGAYNRMGRYLEAIVDARRALDADPDHRCAYPALLRSHAAARDVEKLRAVLDELAAASAGWTQGAARAWAHALASAYHRRLRDNDRALDEASRAIEADPEDYWNYITRARVRRMLEDREGFEADCSAAAAMPLDEPEPLLARAGVLMHDCRRYERALADYDRLTVEYPAWHEAWEQRGRARGFLERYEEAQVDFTRAIELAPDYALAYTNRGVVLGRLRRYEAQIADYERSLELSPHDKVAINNLADARATRLGGYEDALRDLDRVFELDRAWAFAHQHRASLLNALGRFEEAAESAEQALQLDPDELWGYVQAFEARANRYEADEARSVVDRMLAATERWRRDDAARAHAMGAEFLRRLGDLDAALAAADRAVELAPGDHRGLAARVQVRYRRGELQAYRADCEALAALSLEQPADLLERGERLGADCGRWESALGDAARAIELNPEDPGAYVRRAEAYEHLGRLGPARADLDRALELDPSDRQAHAAFGRHLAMLGDCRAAAAELTRAVELAGQDATVWAACAWTHAALLADGCTDYFDAATARDLARRAVAAGPREPNHQSALGAVLHRSGRFEPAREALARALADRAVPDAADLFHLALVEQALHVPEAARDARDRGLRRMAAAGPAYPPYLRMKAALGAPL